MRGRRELLLGAGTTTADSNGTFAMKNLPPGDYVLELEHAGPGASRIGRGSGSVSQDVLARAGRLSWRRSFQPPSRRHDESRQSEVAEKGTAFSDRGKLSVAHARRGSLTMPT